MAGGGGAVSSAWLTPALMVYYLCCWPGKPDSDTNSAKSVGRRGILRHDSGSHRRASEFFSRRMGSSAVSLHLPSTSGVSKESLCQHRSHEEIRPRGAAPGPRAAPAAPGARHHSAPSVIDEVLHRRAWQRSARDLRPPRLSPDSPEAPRAASESSSIRDGDAPGPSPPSPAARACKKHHTNIKSSKRRSEKERARDDDKDSDATEGRDTPAGDNDRSAAAHCTPPPPPALPPGGGKEAKQTFNESLRARAEPPAPRLGFRLDDVIGRLDWLDRSGAAHAAAAEPARPRPPLPPPSVEAVGYEGGACYLPCVTSRPAEAGVGAGAGAGALRGRHASDGDILAPAALRPQSTAFSESDLELELEAPEELPPPYAARDDTSDRRETAI